MNDLIRRVMDAIHEAEPGGYEAQARAAIAAMLEPTEAMMAAGRKERQEGFGATYDIYQAMIDAAQEP